jgi:hypothetical protein
VRPKIVAYLHNHRMKRVALFLFLFLLASCATIVAPSGGPQDRTAPTIKTSTLPDSSVNFKGGVIKLTFDENIQATGIVLNVFPLTAVNPKVTVHKKVLSIHLPDSLLEQNTTYKLNFGNTVKDIYEGTAYNNLGFTFSTGNSLDTLILQGNVLQANTGKADTGVHVLLYSKLNSDSDITFKRPLYVLKVDDNGRFLFTNLPKKEFHIYAVKNINNNFMYDAPGERIAFLEKPIMPNTNGGEAITLFSFSETSDTVSTKVKSRLGAKQIVASNNSVLVNIDTINKTKRTHDITQSITITYSKIISKLDIGKIRLLQDSLIDASAIVTLDSTKKIVSIKTDFAQNANYTLQLLDGYILDSVNKIPGNTFAFKTKNESDYGIIRVDYQKPIKDFNRILQLWYNEKLLETRILDNKMESFGRLNPGAYTLRVVLDENNNGKWDNGSFRNPTNQPEHTEEYGVPILLKANMENKIIWKEELGKTPRGN